MLMLGSSFQLGAQVDVEISYNPGFSTVLPGWNLSPRFTNAGLLFLVNSGKSETSVFGGVQFLSRGSGARVAVLQNGSFIRYEWTAENYFHSHIPVGLRFKHQGFYVDGGVALDQFLYYRQKRGGRVTETEAPTPEQHVKTLFGLHLEGGLLTPISQSMMLKSGIQITNTFSSTPVYNFLNINVSVGLMFNFSGSNEMDSEIEEDDIYEY